MSDPWSDPEAQEWVEHCRKTLVPMLDDSAVSISLAPPVGQHDIKYAVELGLSILMDKPILLVVREGDSVPTKLRSVADDIFYMNWDDAGAHHRLAEHVAGFARRFAGDEEA